MWFTCDDRFNLLASTLAYALVCVLQNLMSAAIYASTQGLASNIRRVLAELHANKRLGATGSVDGMLVRLYEPILFRATAVANPAVRRNALQLLLDAFPLVVSHTC